VDRQQYIKALDAADHLVDTCVGLDDQELKDAARAAQRAAWDALLTFDRRAFGITTEGE
jgi:hypothetical protein